TVRSVNEGTPSRNKAVGRMGESGKRACRSLRIVHLGKFYPPATGGMETHVRTLALAQVAEGADVTVVCVNHAVADGVEAADAPFARTITRNEDDGGVHVVRLGRVFSIAKLEVTSEVRLLRRLVCDSADVVH